MFRNASAHQPNGHHADLLEITGTPMTGSVREQVVEGRSLVPCSRTETDWEDDWHLVHHVGAGYRVKPPNRTCQSCNQTNDSPGE